MFAAGLPPIHKLVGRVSDAVHSPEPRACEGVAVRLAPVQACAVWGAPVASRRVGGRSTERASCMSLRVCVRYTGPVRLSHDNIKIKDIESNYEPTYKVTFHQVIAELLP